MTGQLTLALVGPMTGLPDYNYPAFHAAADRLRAVGFAVVSPAVHDDWSQPWDFYLRHSLRGLLDCDAVATLPGWQQSRGATLELTVADVLGMPWRTVDEWVGARG